MIRGYIRPGEVSAAASLLREQGTVALAGGSRLVPAPPQDVDTLVDLGALCLNCVGSEKEMVNFGAMLRLGEAAGIDPWENLLRDAILCNAPSPNLRNQMTIGGETAWRAPDAEIQPLQVALLALDATVLRHDLDPAPMADYLNEAGRPGLITAVMLPSPPGWRYRFRAVEAARGARPALALACAVLIDKGRLGDCRFALGLPGLVAARLREFEKTLRGAQLSALSAERLLKALPEQGDRDEPWREWTARLVARFLADVEVGDAV